MTTRMVQLREVAIALASVGSRESHPLLVVHGGPDWDHSYLRRPIDELADARRVLWIDLRGCGDSTQGLPPTACQPDKVVDDLVELLDALGIESADVLGFSYGGLLAQRLAISAPQRVTRLILASTTAYGTSGETDMADSGGRRVPAGAALDVLNSPELSPREKTRELAFRTSPLDIWDLTRLERYEEEILSRVKFSGDWMTAWQGGQLKQALIPDAETALGTVAVPVKILHGRHDMRFPVQHAERLHAALPSSQLSVIDHAGHMAHWEQPQRWIASLRRLVSS